MSVVIDCSVAMAWCFDDEKTPRTEDLLDRLMAGEVAHAPSLWMYEATNVLSVGIRRGRLSSEDAFESLNDLWQLRIQLHEPDPGSQARVVTLAEEHGLSGYDAAYVELALRLDASLATLDKKLRAAATSAGVVDALAT